MVLPRYLLLGLAVSMSILFLACSAPPTPTPTKAPTAAPPPAATAAAPKAPAATPAASTAVPSAATPAAKAAADKPLDPPVEVKMGGVGAATEAGMFIGIERGYFAEQGIKGEWQQFDNAPKMIPALATDQVQVASGAVSAGLFNAIARGLPIRIAMAQARYDPGFSAVHILVRKDLADSGAIKDYKDLKGKTVALPSTASATQFSLFKTLEKGGLTLGDVKSIEMPFPDMVAALGNKAVDFALVSEPTATIAVDRGFAVLWHQVSDVVPGIQFTVITLSPKMTQNPELAGRFAIGYLKALRDYNDAFRKNKGREEIIPIFQKYTTIKDRPLYDKMVYSSLDPNGKINIDSVKEQLAWFTSMGQIEGKVDLDSAIDMRFVDYALSRIGQYQ